MAVCEFCGVSGIRMSREDFFPRWQKKLVPLQAGGHFNRAKGTFANRDVGTKTVPACVKCNNEWMSELQNQAKPILTPFIMGEREFLTDQQAATIAKWAMMTSISMEGDDPDNRIIPIEERSKFSQDRIVPDHWQIFIGRSPWVSSRGFSCHPRKQWSSNGTWRPAWQGTTFAMGRMIIVTYSNYIQIPSSSKNLRTVGMFDVHPKFDASININLTKMNPNVDVMSLDELLIPPIVRPVRPPQQLPVQDVEAKP